MTDHHSTIAQRWASAAPAEWTMADLAAWCGDIKTARRVADRGGRLGYWHRTTTGIYRPGRAEHVDARGRARVMPGRRAARAQAASALTTDAAAAAAGVSARTIRREPAWIAAARDRQRAEESKILVMLAEGVTARSDISAALGLTEHRIALAMVRMRRAGTLPPAVIGRPKAPPKPKPPPKPTELRQKPGPKPKPKPPPEPTRLQLRHAAEDAEVLGLWRRGLRSRPEMCEATGMVPRAISRILRRLRDSGAIRPHEEGATICAPPPLTAEAMILRALDDEPWSTAEEIGADEHDVARLVKAGLVRRGTGGALALTADGLVWAAA